MISLRKSIVTAGALIGSFVIAIPAFAQTTGLINPLQATTLQQLLQEILSYVVVLGSIFLTIMIIYVGFLFVSARGNAEKVSQARSALLWTVVGGLLLLGASALSIVITSTASSL